MKTLISAFRLLLVTGMVLSLTACGGGGGGGAASSGGSSGTSDTPSSPTLLSQSSIQLPSQVQVVSAK